MEFALTQEQSLLRDSARRFLADGSRAAAPAELWPELAGLGWLALTLPQAHGGMAPAPVEVALIAEELGRHRIVEPWVASIVVAATLLADAGPADLLAEHAPGIIAFRAASQGSIWRPIPPSTAPPRPCCICVTFRSDASAWWRRTLFRRSSGPWGAA
jgi:alkylation response protein AidB-like acyl-CoA dehydrogenase